MQYRYEKTHKIHIDKHKWICTQWNGPSLIKPIQKIVSMAHLSVLIMTAQLHYTIQCTYQSKLILSIKELRYRSYTHTHLYPKTLPPSLPISILRPHKSDYLLMKISPLEQSRRANFHWPDNWRVHASLCIRRKWMADSLQAEDVICKSSAATFPWQSHKVLSIPT